MMSKVYLGTAFILIYKNSAKIILTPKVNKSFLTIITVKKCSDYSSIPYMFA